MPVGYGSAIDDFEKKRRKELARQFLSSAGGPGSPPPPENGLDMIIDRTSHLTPQEFESQFTPGQTPTTLPPDRQYKHKGDRARAAMAPPQTGTQQQPLGPNQDAQAANAQQLAQSPSPSPRQTERATGAVTYDQATQHNTREDPDANSLVNFFKEQDRTLGGSSRARRRIAPEAFKMEMGFLAGQHEEFEALRGQLTQQYERMDAPARAQFNEMNKRTDAVERAFGDGKINQLEYYRSLNTVNQQAQRYKWQYHFIAPGGQIGDTVVQDGEIKTRTKEGLMPTGYTPEHIKKNIVDLGGGKIAVLTAPGKPYEIVDQEVMNRDLTIEREMIKDMEDAIGKQYGHVSKAWEELNTIEDPITREKKQLQDFTPDVQEELMLRARNQAISIRKQARHATKAVMDDGVPPGGEAIKAQTSDPFEQERNAKIQQMQQKKTAEAEEAAMMEQISTLFAAPGSKQKPAPTAQPQNHEDMQAAFQVDTQVMDKIKGAKTDAEALQIRADNWQSDPILAHKVMKPMPITKQTKPSDIPDGTVVLRPDGRRFLKKGKQFYPIPFE